MKSDFYDGGVFADQAHSIISERDPGVHGDMRKFLSHAFSEKSLKSQEPLINEVVDEFVAQLGSRAANVTGVDIVMWYNMTTFDIIGSLAFGESFGAVRSGKEYNPYVRSMFLMRDLGLQNPWISLIIKAVGQNALADTMNRFPFFATLFKFVLPKKLEALIEDTKTHEANTLAMVKKLISPAQSVSNRASDLMFVYRRLQNPSSRPDFLTRMLEQKSQEHTDVQIAAHASDFV